MPNIGTSLQACAHSKLEPVSGAFDVTVAPGDDVQAAIDRCPPGGCVLLLPGTHEGPLVLGPREAANGGGAPVQVADKEVHVFGRGRATLRAATGESVLTCRAATATCDGLVVRQEAAAGVPDDDELSFGVTMEGSASRLQACDLSSTSGPCVYITDGKDPVVTGTDPLLIGCKCVRWP